MPLLFLLIILWFSYLLLEAYLNRKYLASFRAVIHVNGIRGKTSTCRAIDAALRTRYRVFTKTTGTDAAAIDVSGIEHPVRRLGPANIHEQLRMIRRAHKEGAEILILECMAVNPVLQKTAQEQIVRGSICVITNVRYDHVFEMGDTKEEIASALSAVIPEHGVLVTADPLGETYFGDACRRKGTELVLCLPDENEAGTAAENELIARAVSRRLGITEEEFLRSRSRVQEDFGVRRIYDVTTSEGIPCRFLNLFSANDPESTHTNLDDALGRMKKLPADSPGEGPAGVPLVFLYNHRADRPDRALLFARHFIPQYLGVPVYLSGEGASLAGRMFRKAGAGDVRVLGKQDVTDLNIPGLLPGTLIAGIGNIKGPAFDLILKLEQTKGNREDE